MGAEDIDREHEAHDEVHRDAEGKGGEWLAAGGRKIAESSGEPYAQEAEDEAQVRMSLIGAIRPGGAICPGTGICVRRQVEAHSAPLRVPPRRRRSPNVLYSRVIMPADWGG